MPVGSVEASFYNTTMPQRTWAFISIVVVVLMVACHARAQSVVDDDLRVRTYVSGFSSPTGVADVGNGDLLVIQKNDGRVRLVRDRQIEKTVLNLPVSTSSERGLLGIALHPNFARNGFVYLYYTRAASDGGEAQRHRIDRFRWTGEDLRFDKIIKKLPAQPGPNHDGGKITFGPDGKLYAVIGDLNRTGRTQNVEDSDSLDRTGVILRLNAGGKSPKDNPFYRRQNIGTPNAPLNDIFAYGVRNSFGLAFDPVTDVLWDTENGPSEFDEINRVRPGFNSGWRDIMGPAERSGGTDGLVSFGDRARYADPKFSWKNPVAPTDLEFLANDSLGGQYENDLFVGDVNTGSLYRFDLTKRRKALRLSGDLSDRVADNDGSLLSEQDDILFGSNFGGISDLLATPDGLFVVSITNDAIYQITDRVTNRAPLSNRVAYAGLTDATIVPEPPALLLVLIGAVLTGRRFRKRHPLP